MSFQLLRKLSLGILLVSSPASSSLFGGEILDFALRTDFDGSDTPITFEVITKGQGTAPLVMRAFGPSLDPYTARPLLQNPSLDILYYYGGVFTSGGLNERWSDRDGDGSVDSPSSLVGFLEAVGKVGMVDFASTSSEDAAFVEDVQEGSVFLHMYSPLQAEAGEALMEVATADSSSSLDIVAFRARRTYHNGGGTTKISFSLSNEGLQRVLIKTLSGSDLDPYGFRAHASGSRYRAV